MQCNEVGEKRRFERYQRGRWVRLSGMQQLCKGDRFRVFEPDGTPHIAIAGRTEFIATSPTNSGPLASGLSSVKLRRVPHVRSHQVHKLWRCQL